MKYFIGKCTTFLAIFLTIIILVNYFTDPANLYHTDMVKELVDMLSTGHTVSVSGDMDERLYQELRIKTLNKKPEMVILGSSHVMMIPWKFENYYMGAVSGAVIEDIIGVLGILNVNNKMPVQVLIGVDPWIFYENCEENRYKSIQNYIDYQMRIIDSEQNVNIPLEGPSVSSKLDKLKELYSFSYFQSSAKTILKNIAGREESNVLIESNDDIGEREKIVPNGRRIPSISRFHKTIENIASARQAINNNSIYYLSGFSELSSEKVEIFENTIDYLQSQNVKVEFYLPAWFPEYYDEFKINESLSGVIKAESYIRKMAERREIIVRGSYDPSVMNISSDDFMDDLHLKPEIGLDSYNYVAN